MDPSDDSPERGEPTVGDVMHAGVLSCSSSETLAEAAERLGRHRIHALVVEGGGADAGLRVLADVDLVQALGRGIDPGSASVEEIAATEPVTISAAEPVKAAARTMSDHEVSHLIVVDDDSGQPTGVISSLDVVRTAVRQPPPGATLSMVVAHDGGPGGDDAAALARMLAGEWPARAVAAIVVPFPPNATGDPPLRAKPGAQTWQQLCDDLTAQGNSVLESRVRPLIEGVAFERRVLLDDSAARALSSLCESERPDLLVAGSSRRGPLGRLAPGATTERLINGASSPVAIAPAGYAEDAAPIATVGVGFDGSPTAARAVRLAARLADRQGAELRVLAVVEPATFGELEVAGEALDVLSGRGISDRRADRLRAAAEAEIEPADGRSKLAIEVPHGDPGELLQGLSHDVDLLVVGSRGYGPLRRVILGSVSAKVARAAACPVAITPRG
jgi:nucleotide-binding universal stress UspA family protein/CBS domain-containing protein